MAKSARSQIFSFTTSDSTIQDLEMKGNFRHWRIRIMYGMIIGYATFYLLRMNMSMAIPAIREQFSYTKADIGVILTCFSIIYGMGKFINGFFSDRSNARYFMTAGLLLSALINIFMGLSNSLLMFGIFWSLNAWFQSMAWPPIARMLTHWFSSKELGMKWGLCNSSHQIGAALIFVFGAWLIKHHGWQTAFFVPAAIAIVVAFFLYDRLRDTPASVGLPSVEVYKGDTSNAADEDTHLTHKELIHKVMRNRLLWYVCIGNMFLYVVRMGIFNWAPTYLSEMKGSNLMTAGWQGAASEIAGIIGGITAGWMSDKFFHGRRGAVSVLYMTMLTIVLFYFWQVPEKHIFIDTLVMCAIGFFVYGPQVLAGVAAADFASKKAVGVANGLTGTFGYIGGAISGIGVGKIADIYGWQGGFLFLLLSACCGTLAFALTLRHRSVIS